MIANHRIWTAGQSTATRQRTSRRRWTPYFIAIGAIVTMILGSSLWLRLLGRFLVVADSLQPANAVVTLSGGGQERVIHGARLFSEGYADWFVVTSMPFNAPGIRASYGELVQREAIWQGVPEERILITPGIVETTYEEAVAVRRLAEEQGWHSLIVVTDPYHTRRTRMAFREVFRGSSIAVAVRPVNDHWYQVDSWWRSRNGLRETWTEYAKLVLHVIGYK